MFLTWETYYSCIENDLWIVLESFNFFEMSVKVSNFVWNVFDMGDLLQLHWEWPVKCLSNIRNVCVNILNVFLTSCWLVKSTFGHFEFFCQQFGRAAVKWLKWSRHGKCGKFTICIFLLSFALIIPKFVNIFSLSVLMYKYTICNSWTTPLVLASMDLVFHRGQCDDWFA